MEIQKLVTSIIDVKAEVPEIVELFHRMEEGDVTCLQEVIKNYADILAYSCKMPSNTERQEYKSTLTNVSNLLCRCRSRRRFFW